MTMIITNQLCTTKQKRNNKNVLGIDSYTLHTQIAQAEVFLLGYYCIINQRTGPRLSSS